jgi:hypothetical protein
MNAEHARRDPDFDNLRDREDFKNLLAEMEAKAQSLRKKTEPSASKLK